MSHRLPWVLGSLVALACAPSLASRDPGERLAAMRELANDRRSPSTYPLLEPATQNRLSRLALTDPDPAVRKAAVGLLAPHFLIDVACQTEDGAAGLAALAKLRSEEDWELIARCARNLEVGLAAVRRVKRPMGLQLVAFHADRREVAVEAVTELQDQALMLDVARKSRDGEVRLAAIHRLSKPEDLARIALCAQDGASRAAARSRLNDDPGTQALAWACLTGYLGKECKDEESCGSAIQDADQVTLKRVARTSRDVALRRSVVPRLTDQQALFEVATLDAVQDVRLAAVARLEKSELLKRVALDGLGSGTQDDLEVRRAAVTAADQETRFRVAVEARNAEVRDFASAQLGAPYVDRLEPEIVEHLNREGDVAGLRAFCADHPKAPASRRARSYLLGHSAIVLGDHLEALRPGEYLARPFAAGGLSGTLEQGGGLEFTSSEQERKAALEEFRDLLAAGADPSSIRIQEARYWMEGWTRHRKKPAPIPASARGQALFEYLSAAGSPEATAAARMLRGRGR